MRSGTRRAFSMVSLRQNGTAVKMVLLEKCASQADTDRGDIPPKKLSSTLGTYTPFSLEITNTAVW